MNQIWKFEFILRATAKRAFPFLLFSIITGQLDNAAAQEPLPLSVERSYYSQWNQAEPSDSSPVEIQDAPVVETRFFQSSGSNSERVQSQAKTSGAPAQDRPTPAGQLPSTFSDISQYISGQFNKLFGRSSIPSNGPDIKRMIGALSLVLGGYFGFVWLLRMLSPRSNRQLPSEVIEVLGKTAFGKGQHLQLVRLGSKLLLLLESNEGIQPIAEISDPLEVHHLISCCDPFPNRRRGRRLNPAKHAPDEPQVHSFRIPAVNPEPAQRLALDSSSPNLADVIRVIENAASKTQPRHRNSYEA